MKRMIAFFILLILLIGFKVVSEGSLPQYKFEKLVIISHSPSLFNCEKIENGNQFYYSFDSKTGENIIKNLNIYEIDGIVYYFNKSLNIKDLINKLDFCYKAEDEIKNLQIYYGYDKSYPDYRLIDGKKVNVQIVENSTNILMGYPMILCGY